MNANTSAHASSANSQDLLDLNQLSDQMLNNYIDNNSAPKDQQAVTLPNGGSIQDFFKSS